MLSTSTWILIMLLLAVIGIFIPDDEITRDYDCYDKSPYKCGNCHKDCKWRDIVLDAEEISKNLSDAKYKEGFSFIKSKENKNEESKM